MKARLVLICTLVLVGFLLGAGQGYCLQTDVEFHGHVQATGVLRDTNGFQYGLLDESQWVQFRNECKFDLRITPKYDIRPKLTFEKLYLSYRGAYDAIYDFTDRYREIQDSRGASRYDLGLDNVKYENDLREVFVDFQYMSSQTGTGYMTNLRVGRQIVQWGEAGVFNVVNIINPQDLSSLRNFDNPDQLANPIWMSRLDFATPQIGIFNELSVQFLYIPDNRPSIYGPSNSTVGAPYSIYVPGLNVVQNDHASSLTDPQYGIRLGASSGNLKTYLYYFNGYQAGPALNFSNLAGGELILDHPSYHMIGASFNYGLGSSVIRGEGTYTGKEYYTDYASGMAELYSGHKTYQALLGWDTSFFSENGFPGAGGTPLTTSFEAYWKHIEGWEYDSALRNGAKTDEYGVTFVANTFFFHGKLLPVFALWYDFNKVLLTSTSLEYTFDGKWFTKLSVSAVFGDNEATYSKIVSLINSSEIGLRVGYRW